MYSQSILAFFFWMLTGTHYVSCTHSIADYHQMYDQLPTLIWITDQNGMVIFLNRCYQEYVGIDNIHDSSWTDFLHDDDKTNMEQQRTVAFKERSTFDTQYRLKGTNGKYKWFLSRASPTFDEEGKIIRWFGVNTDINDKVKAFEKEERQNVWFASNIHEIKTPLAGIIGLTEILLQTELTDDQRSDLDAVLQCGNNVVSLTANLLDFCKLESNKLTLEVAPFSLEQLLKHLVKMTRLMKHQDITLDISEELKEPNLIEGDYGRVNQIFTNIVTNAAKFTPPDGSIIIDVRLGPRRANSELTDSDNEALAPIVVHCRISDSGIGIDPESIPNLFKPFSQNKNARNSGIKGHGLGLFITKNLLRLMDGQIKIQSDQTGTTITFTIPYRPYTERRHSTSSTETNSFDLAHAANPSLCIMVVEDNHITRNIVKRLLERHNIKVYAMGNGQSAIDSYPEIVDELDAVLLDLYLPDMLGLDVLNYMDQFSISHQNDERPPVIIAFTASGESEIISGNFDGIIYKPFRQDDFMLKLRQFAQSRRQL